ncbi:MAG: dockerin type I domain-containing protein [Hespellia sp.]|nr:dockerin type I domain-containing protein [Hespellia sp.]
MKKKKIIYQVFTALFVFSAGCLLFGQTVHAEEEPEVTIVREATGDLEELKAIRIPDEQIEDYNIASSYENASGSSEQNQFLTFGSRYGYEDMVNRSNTSGRQELYNQMQKICDDFTLSGVDSTDFTMGNMNYHSAGTAMTSVNGMSDDDVIETYFTFRNDNPQYFWLSNWVVYGPNSIVVLTYADYANGMVRQNAFNNILSTLSTVYQNQILETDTKYQKTLKIHDTLIADIVYSYDVNIEIAHSIAGALAGSKSAVCEGYAKVMQLLLNEYNISNVYVIGDAGGGHAWNMVKMKDENYYWLDATWDDQPYEEIQHTYFLVGNQNFTDHQPNSAAGTGTEFLYTLPTASDNNYVDNPDVLETMAGDVNKDNVVNLKDLMIVLKHVSGKELMTQEQCQIADVTRDGAVNLKDLMQMLKYVSGKISGL